MLGGSKKVMTKKNPVPRKHVRYKSLLMSLEPYALIDRDTENASFQPTIPGFIINESHGGCSLLLSSGVTLKKDGIIKVKTGDLNPMKAEVRWKRKLDEDIVRIGLKYLE